MTEKKLYVDAYCSEGHPCVVDTSSVTAVEDYGDQTVLWVGEHKYYLEMPYEEYLEMCDWEPVTV